MQCPRCHSPLEDGAVFCGNCGAQVAPLNAQGATAENDGTLIIPERSVGAANSINTFPNTSQAAQQGAFTNMRTAQTPQQQGPNPYATVMSQPPEYRGATPLPTTATPSPTPTPPQRSNRRSVILVS